MENLDKDINIRHTCWLTGGLVIDSTWHDGRHAISDIFQTSHLIRHIFNFFSRTCIDDSYICLPCGYRKRGKGEKPNIPEAF